MIEIKSIHKSFGKNKVLQGVDLIIPQGNTIAIMGPNGSGKTTLIKSILGMVLPNQGNILMNGKNIQRSWKYRNQIDYLPQIANFPNNLKVSELIKMIKDIRGGEIVEEDKYINLFSLHPFLNKKLGNLSGGTKQKVNLVIALMFESPLIILDEPTSGLDPVSLLVLKDIIIEQKKKGKTLLICSHIMSFVEAVCDTIIFIWEGKIYFNGTISALKKETAEDDFEHAIAHLLKNAHV
ncbi:MAG: ABC transporter ATP-binding protein [Flavobacteriaceae bacterium]|nr:ABC transporter ATP-binding protein [Flavobacteriaceae bacterium]